MDYKVLFLRTVSSFFLSFFLCWILIFKTQYINSIIILIYLIIIIEILFFFKNKKVIILTYLFLSFLSIEYFIFFSFNKYFFITLILLIIYFDTFSYLFGSLFGKSKIIPLISPNKTYEGFVLGYLSSIILTHISISFFYTIDLFDYLIISGLIIFLSFIGDLLQSYFKRLSFIKDSSFFLPGHGGLFDRFDGFILVFSVIPFLVKFI